MFKISRSTRVIAAATFALLMSSVAHRTIAQEIKPGGTLVVAINDNPPNFVTGVGTNILTIATGGQIFDTLIKVDSKFKIVPSLAKSWESSADGLHFTFHLEPNVKWHDGKPFTSDDVKYSILEIDGKYNSLAIQAYQPIASIDTPDPLTIVINLKGPDPAFFPWAFSQPNFAQIFPKHLYEGTDPRNNPANLKPVGTGPFKFKEWVRGSHIVLERNPEYFHKDIFIDRLVFQIVPDPGARQIALEKGEIDHIPYFGLAPSSIEPLAANKATAVIDSLRPALGEIIAFFNFRNPILAKKEVRQAISKAIDRKAIVQLALNGRATPAAGPVRSDNPPFFDPSLKPQTRDVAGANKLLDDAGYPRRGSTPRFSIKLSYGAAEEGGALQSAGEIMREQLKDVGIDLQLQPSDSASWQEQTQQWNFDLTMGSFGTGPDPKIAVTRLYTTDNIRHTLGSNVMGYSNPALDALLKQADNDMNPETRAQTYRKAQAIMVDELPALWLWEKFYPIAIRKGLVGLPSGSMHSEVFEGVGWAK